MRTINIGPYLRSLIITWRPPMRVGVSCVPVGTERRACMRTRGGTVVYARIGTGYRTPRDTRVGHASL